jgi:hypothetical protein
MSAMNRNYQETRTKVADAHRVNLQKNLERRMEAARASGNDSLVRMLEAEANYIR